MALLSMALNARGVPAVSFTGSQSGIVTNDAHTNARIVEVRPFRVQDELAQGKVVIVAGYQGVSYRRDITTLGRGGSDTTAVALAAALEADCEIYSRRGGRLHRGPARGARRAAPGRAQLRGDAGAGGVGGEGPERAGGGVRQGEGHRDLRARHARRQGDRGAQVPAALARPRGGRGQRDRPHRPHHRGRRTRLSSSACSSTSTSGRSRASSSSSRMARRAAAPARSSCRWRTCTTSPPCAATSRARLRAASQLRDGLGAVSAIGAGINASFDNLRRAFDVLARPGATGARRLDLQLPHQPARRGGGGAGGGARACTPSWSGGRRPSSSPRDSADPQARDLGDQPLAREAQGDRRARAVAAVFAQDLRDVPRARRPAPRPCSDRAAARRAAPRASDRCSGADGLRRRTSTTARWISRWSSRTLPGQA